MLTFTYEKERKNGNEKKNIGALEFGPLSQEQMTEIERIKGDEYGV